MPSRGAFIDSNGVRWVRGFPSSFFLILFVVLFMLLVLVAQDTNSADYEGFLSKKSKWMGG
jgi:hypothetical protein